MFESISKLSDAITEKGPRCPCFTEAMQRIAAAIGRRARSHGISYGGNARLALKKGRSREDGLDLDDYRRFRFRTVVALKKCRHHQLPRGNVDFCLR